MSERLICLLLLLWFAPLRADAPTAGVIEFTSEERRQIVSLGPWPPPPRADPSNRVSGQRKAIELGRRLFSDPRMSSVGYIACVTCHQPDRAFTDLKARAHGLADLTRHTPSLLNVNQQRWLGWDGASDSLWMASIRPILDPREFDGSIQTVVRVFERDRELAACYREAFQDSPKRDGQRTLVNVGKALAAFQETLVTERTSFDEFRDAMEGGDRQKRLAYPLAAQRGLRLFIRTGRCIHCHSGPNFSDGAFHRGWNLSKETALAGKDDAGRFEGLSRLAKSRWNLAGPYNDDAASRIASGKRDLQAGEDLRGHFRTPSLRNVAVTGPYMHDGSVNQLQDALQHALPPVAPETGSTLTSAQREDLVAFLATLTDRHGQRRPWSSSPMPHCP